MNISAQSRHRLQSRRKGDPATRNLPCPSPPTRVCYFDQNPRSLPQLTRLLPRSEFEVVSEDEIRSGQPPSAPGRLVLVMDAKHLIPLHRPFLQMLTRRFPEAKILALGEKPPQREGSELLRGIHGFVLYAQAKPKLAPALRALSNDHWWLPHTVFEHFAQLSAMSNRTQESARLTPREAQILALHMNRLSNKEIAGNLNITERTVKFHLAKIFDKLGVRDRHNAAEMADSGHALGPELVAA